MAAPCKPASPQQRPKRRDARKNRQTLLQAACDLVSESGISALTVAAVARRANLNRSTAYQHFNNREEIVQAVNEHFAEQFRDLSQTPRPIGEHFDFFVDHFRTNPDIARVWIYQLLQGEGVPLAEFNSGAIERLADSNRGQDDIDTEMLAIIATSSAMMWSLISGQQSGNDQAKTAASRRFTRELKRLFLYGAFRPDRWPELVADLQEK